MKIGIKGLCLFVVLLHVTFFKAQIQKKYTVFLDNSKSTYGLNDETNKNVLYKGYLKILELKLSETDAEPSYYLLIKTKTLELFNVETEEIFVTEKIKNPSDCYLYKELKGQRAGILSIYTLEGLKMIYINSGKIIYPKEKPQINKDISVSDKIPGFLIVGALDETGNYKQGVIDFNGNLILGIAYDEIYDYDAKNDLFVVISNKKYAAVDRSGKVKIPFDYVSLEEQDGFYVAITTAFDRVGVITPNDTILPFYFSKNNARGAKPYYKNGAFTMLLEGEEIKIDTSKLSLTRAKNYFKTYKTANYYTKYTYKYAEKQFADEETVSEIVNTETNEVTISKEYKLDLTMNPSLFKGGVGVGKNGKWGMLNIETGKVMIPFEYDLPYMGSNPDPATGYRHLKGSFKTYYLLKSRTQFDDTVVFLIVKKNGRYGVIDLSGKVCVPFVYDQIYATTPCQNRDFIMVQKNGLFGLLDEKTFGELLPCEYEEIFDCKFALKIKTDQERLPIGDDGKIH